MKLNVLRQFAPQLNQIAQKHGISRVYVFGSVARGDATRVSDVDFLLEMQPGASLFGAAGFSYEAEKLLNLKVDIVPKTTLSENKNVDFFTKIKNEMKII